MVKARSARRGQRGFTLIEIAVGLFVLALACVCLAGYSASQRRGLEKSSQLADATQAAASALENIKGQLSDSIAFKKAYDGAKGKTVTQASQQTINKGAYAVTLTLARAPDPLYALNIRAKVTWQSKHSLVLGLLYPGASNTL